MSAATFSHLFEPGHTELLPPARDLYLRRALAPDDQAQVEAFLAQHPLERDLTLARFRGLQAVCERKGLPPLTPPAWALAQPAAPAPGPRRRARRPAGLVGLGVLLLVSGLAIAHWVRQRAPAPPAGPQAALSAASPLAPGPAAAPASAAAVSGGARAAAPAPGTPASAAPQLPVAEAPAAPSAAVDPLAQDPAARTPLGPAQPDSSLRRGGDGLGGGRGSGSDGAPGGAAPASSRQVLRGRVFDQQGRPLPGATVLVRGTGQVAVTNADGAYELEAPKGATLQVGYAGYGDEQLTTGKTTEGLDVTLEPRRDGRGRRP